MRLKHLRLGIVALGALAFSATARAQSQVIYVGPVSPNGQPQYVQPTMTYPQAPGGFVTGNPTPVYDPNAVVGGNGSGMTYWDPYRGWVSHTQNTSVLNSATSEGRAPAAGSTIQSYNYWDGTQWVQGTRWLGQDGLWHGTNANTVVGPNGSTHQNMTVYAPNPMAGGSAGVRPSHIPQRPRVR